ncbi:uncharacterized protein JCM15063_000154 [Sporobolomyces koalae]|uniref:uncharacterized protein n=1 Tax=Sporobolomyces koalae TaxID=500713 RepID=UPI00317D990F
MNCGSLEDEDDESDARLASSSSDSTDSDISLESDSFMMVEDDEEALSKALQAWEQKMETAKETNWQLAPKHPRSAYGTSSRTTEWRNKKKKLDHELAQDREKAFNGQRSITNYFAKPDKPLPHRETRPSVLDLPKTVSVFRLPTPPPKSDSSSQLHTPPLTSDSSSQLPTPPLTSDSSSQIPTSPPKDIDPLLRVASDVASDPEGEGENDNDEGENDKDEGEEERPQKRRRHADPRRTQTEVQDELKTIGAVHQARLSHIFDTWKVRVGEFESCLQCDRCWTLRGFYTMLKNGSTRMEASTLAAQCAGLGKYNGPRVIRKWARDWEKTGELPTSDRGKYRKVSSLFDDADVRDPAVGFMRTNKLKMNSAELGQYQRLTRQSEQDNFLRRRCAKVLLDYLETTLFPRIGVEALRWMQREGFRFRAVSEGIYVDGLEPPDEGAQSSTIG